MQRQTIIQDGVLQTLCRQCEQRCGIDVIIEYGKIVRIQGNPMHKAAGGKLCGKAELAIDQEYHPDRLHKPLKKNRHGAFVEISYEKAMDEIAEKMKRIRSKYSAKAMGVWTGEAIGFNEQEEYARRFIHAFGSPNYFSADSVCFSSKLIGYSLVQGYWNSFPDIENANVVILWGVNPPLTRPPIFHAIKKAKKKGANIIVVDPKCTAAARQADIWLRPRPGTDGALAWGIINRLISAGSYDKVFVNNHSVGFDQFSKYAKSFQPEFVNSNTGVSLDKLEKVCMTIEKGMPQIINYLGIALEHQVNGGNTARTIACLGGLCGAVDVHGGDLWVEGMKRNKLTLYDKIPLLDQNPIGAKHYPLLYKHRKQCHSMSSIDYMLGKGEYPLRGLIITGANPVLTNPNSKKVIKAFKSLDLLVCHELFLTKTAELADYILPAASFLGRSELHYHHNPPLVTLTTKIINDHDVTDQYNFWKDLADRFSFGPKYFPWENEDEVNQWILKGSDIDYEELKSSPEGLLYSSINYKKYKTRPFDTPTGKFEFTSSIEPKPGFTQVSEYIPPRYLIEPSKDYPLVLITGGRKVLYYHSRFRNIAKAKKSAPRAEVEIHPSDANLIGIKDKEMVIVRSKIGSISLQAKIMNEDETLPGLIYITHGWNDANVNVLTNDRENDPMTGFPNLRAVPVRLEK